ncbi:MAG: hypothetical protein MPEBLZ_02695 [Candidatus Methanoperedens nitroreducens]|uniref:Uncharacterized protein n=1 Tax=Candidatus Methanoperedens nitratireducens TaxID=1392998 RepID=A0A0P8A3L2_9EURY|nr:MAG: hypothetical protein MPEBLZ_02695 [Candidatus Methanoperedens sp. BLZ1]
MKSKRYITSIVILSALFVVAGSNVASAHCDTMDGPVVKAARDALESGNVNLVLVWVQEKDANEIIATFNKTRDVRQLSLRQKNLQTTGSLRRWFDFTVLEKVRPIQVSSLRGASKALLFQPQIRRSRTKS